MDDGLYIKRVERTILVSRDRTFTDDVLTLSLGQAAMLSDTLTHAQSEKFDRAELAEPEATIQRLALKALDTSKETKQ
jgi:hypothetical protein